MSLEGLGLAFTVFFTITLGPLNRLFMDEKNSEISSTATLCKKGKETGRTPKNSNKKGVIL
jgi:hypothetical protein